MKDDLALYFGPNRTELSELRTSPLWRFCWPGFLFPQAWFLYRKMYGWAALTTAAPTVAFYAPSLAWTVWGTSILGAFGLRLYFRVAERDVAAIRAETADEDEARARIVRVGGVSRFGAAVGAVYIFALFLNELRRTVS